MGLADVWEAFVDATAQSHQHLGLAVVWDCPFYTTNSAHYFLGAVFDCHPLFNDSMHAQLIICFITICVTL